MKQKVYMLMLAFATLTVGAYAQSHNMLNDKPANVKICRSASDKLIKDMTFYKTDGSKHQLFSYEYTKKGILSSESDFMWDKKTEDWKNYKKDTYTYNTENRLVEKTSSFWSNDSWVINSKKMPVYNTESLVSEELYYEWDKTSEDWNPATIKYTYTYNAEGYQTEYLQQLKKASSDTWNDPSSKVVYTRNPAGQVTEELGQNWDSETQTWINSFKYEYNYDASKHQTNVGYYTWKENKWNEGQKTICIYDSDGDLERAEYYRSFDDASLDAYCLYTYTTLEEATNSAKIAAEQFSVYPNPATAYVNLQIPSALFGKTAGLYDTAGRLIKNISCENEVTNIDISELPVGIYFIKIENQTKKVIKQ
jgi:hypothetical protein